MNQYKFIDMRLGMKESFAVEISSQMMATFLNITGDMNPLHINHDYAKTKGFDDIVVYGMLSSSFYSTFVGVYLPGKYCILHSIEIQFLSPVYVGDKLFISGEDVGVNELFKQIEMKVVIKNQNNEKISRAKIKTGIIDE